MKGLKMNRLELTQYILDCYNVSPDHPWMRYPNYDVFRHEDNQKWFALIMNITPDKLGLPGTDFLDVVNLKSDPSLIRMLLYESGFYPAYHMNKTSWITIVLDNSVSNEKIKNLLDLSYEATASETKTKSIKKKL